MAVDAGGGDSCAEQISALVDSELAADEAQQLLAAGLVDAARWRWDCYHLIGDALRAQPASASLAVDLAAAIGRRLHDQP